MSSPEPTDYLRVSYSSLGTAASCWRKFEFDKMYPKRVRTGDDFYAAEVGKALHSGMQHWLTTQDDVQSIWKFMLEFPYESEFNQKNDYRGFEASLNTLEQMFVELRLGEYELATIRRPSTAKEIESGKPEYQDVPAIEVPFEIRFKGLTLPDGRGIAFIGYIDAIMRHRFNGRYKTLDIKTHRNAVKDSTGKYKFDTQQTPYGIVVDHVAKGSVESFDVLYLDCYIDLVEPAVTLYDFQRTQVDIQEWATNKLLEFNDLIRFQQSNYFPRTEHGCMFYNKPCRYLEPCVSRDKESLMEWFLLGETPAEEEPFHPWIIAEIQA